MGDEEEGMCPRDDAAERGDDDLDDVDEDACARFDDERETRRGTVSTEDAADVRRPGVSRTFLANVDAPATSDEDPEGKAAGEKGDRGAGPPVPTEVLCGLNHGDDDTSFRDPGSSIASRTACSTSDTGIRSTPHAFG